MTQCKATDTPGESDHLIYEFVIPSYNWRCKDWILLREGFKAYCYILQLSRLLFQLLLSL